MSHIGYIWYDFDFDGHFGTSDVLLILVLITAIAAAGKVINTAIMYVSRKREKRFTDSVMRAIQPTLDRITVQVEPNGGKSLHDEVKKATKLLAERSVLFTSFENRIGALESGQVRLDQGQTEILSKLTEIHEVQNIIETRRIDDLNETD